MSKLYLGIDWHKNKSTLCTVDEAGHRLETIEVPSGTLVRFLSNRKFETIGIEASGGVNHVVEQLKEAGHNVLILNSNLFRAVGMGGKKTDERDAFAIASALRLNFLPTVHHKSRRARELKSLIISREHLVQARVDHVNHIRGTLREYGITLPVGMDKFLELVSPALRKLPHPLVRTPLEFLLQQIRFLLEQEKVVDAALEEMVRNDPRIARLRSIPGVGPVGSIALAAVIDDIGRFPDAKHFASYLGLVPQEHSSGNKRMMGSITRSGSELVRRYLIHGARAVLLHTSPETKDENRRWALKLKDKIGQNKATVALAHRMARIAWSVLKNERDYTTERPPASRVA